MEELIPADVIERKILLIRGHKVMLDAALAELYGVPTKRLNEQVKRNTDRFPADFAFQLTAAEWANLKSQFATSSLRDTWTHGDVANRSQIATASGEVSSHGGRRKLPWCFTEHGAIMAANVLNSRQAIAMSVYVVRAFVKLREMMALHKDLAKKLDTMEKKYDSQFYPVRDLRLCTTFT
jgi:hypothetical protein